MRVRSLIGFCFGIASVSLNINCGGKSGTSNPDTRTAPTDAGTGASNTGTAPTDAGRGASNTGTAPTDAGRGASDARAALTDARASDGASDTGISHATNCDIPTPWPTPTTPATVVGDGTAGSCTVSALQTAVSKGGLVTFNCGSGNITINVTATIHAPGGTTIIDGGGKLTLDGGKTTQILKMDGGAKLSVRNLTLQNGYFADHSLYGGAAIGPSWGNAVEVINCTITGNYAPFGGGGAIMAQGALTIVGSTISNNSGPYGGAIYNLLAPLTIVNSTLDSNRGKVDPEGNGGNGAAISTDGAGSGALFYCGDTFSNNYAENGSSTWMWAYEPDSIIIKQSTFKNNTSHGGWQGGAALMVISGCDAGHCRYGSQPEPGTFLIEDSSFIGNTADTNGGAIAVGCSGPCNINNSTFYGNNITGGDGSAVFATANSWPGDPGIQFNGVTFAHNGDGEGNSTLSGSNFVINNTVFESSGQKLCSDTNTGSNVLEFVPAGSKGSSSTTHCIPGVPAIIQSDPFPSIADNGGPTFTAMPSMSTGGSQLVGAGSGCLSTDQRGATRNTAKCTLGAVE